MLNNQMVYTHVLCTWWTLKARGNPHFEPWSFRATRSFIWVPMVTFPFSTATQEELQHFAGRAPSQRRFSSMANKSTAMAHKIHTDFVESWRTSHLGYYHHHPNPTWTPGMKMMKKCGWSEVVSETRNHSFLIFKTPKNQALVECLGSVQGPISWGWGLTTPTTPSTRIFSPSSFLISSFFLRLRIF